MEKNAEGGTARKEDKRKTKNKVYGCGKERHALSIDETEKNIKDRVRCIRIICCGSPNGNSQKRSTDTDCVII